jgi:hypothetical protein
MAAIHQRDWGGAASGQQGLVDVWMVQTLRSMTSTSSSMV